MKRFSALIGLAAGLIISLTLCAVAGENPFHVGMILIKSAFGSRYDLGLSLFYTTSLIFTGLSVSIALHAGLFNIGAEGQLSIATLAAAAAGLLFPQLPPVMGFALCALSGILAGALWGMIPGVLKAWRGSHEVIITMMMNFIAAGLISYFVVGALQNTESQNPETASIPTSYMSQSWDPIQKLFPESQANFSFLVAVLLALFIYWFLKHTIYGYEIRVSGKNPEAASFSGLKPVRAQILAMTLSGALAGFVAWNEILGSIGKYRLGFSADYGFIGIAVALLARNNPLAIIASAFLFGSLQKGASDLDIETATITRDFARIIQAIIILSVILSVAYFEQRKQKIKNGK